MELIHEYLRDFLVASGKEDLLRRYEDFLKLWIDTPFDRTLTTELLGNIDFKHRFAKYVVGRTAGEDNYLTLDRLGDARLASFVAYYAAVRLLGGGDTADEAATGRLRSLLGVGGNDYYNTDSGYLPGAKFNLPANPFVPVYMTPGGGLQTGYRLFVVNLLCFRSNRFAMGCRCDSGPVLDQKYNKGCAPIGIETDAAGRRWTLFKVDAALTDDCTAVFSNGLDGDGTVEICDWVSPADVRVVFRTNF
ncbi:MAG: hypothetical protein NC336_10190 [Clostridium sp.]|nr:hypothetical protein [Clostridium sp.]